MAKVKGEEMMKVLLIYDSFLDNGNFKNDSDYVIDKFQQNGIQVIIYLISNEELLAKEISQTNENEYKKIIILGGNRIVNVVINNILKNNIKIPIAIFPKGKKNEHTYFKISKLVKKMINSVLTNNYTCCDIGFVNEQYFMNYVSIGYLIDIDKRITTRVKKNFGVIVNYITGVKKIIHQRSFNVKIVAESLNFEGEILFMLITPSALKSDGFNVIILKKCPASEAMTLMAKIANDEKIKSRHIIHVKTKELTIDSSDRTKIILDEEKGPSFPLTFKLLRQELKIDTKENSKKCLKKKHFGFYELKKAAGGVIYDFKHLRFEPYRKRNFITNLFTVIVDFRRHNPFNYINKNSIENQYFEMAQKTLDNGYLYLIISSTGSPAGEVACRLTQKEYSHSSISFDGELKTIISYNGGEKIFSPGLNHERMNFFCQKHDASLIIYKLKASKHQKSIILDEIKRINEQGSSFNLLGFLSYSHKKNIMFCSQFVYTMLKISGLDYFNKKPEDVRPTDFVELDYERVLKYCNKFYVKDILNNHNVLSDYFMKRKIQN